MSTAELLQAQVESQDVLDAIDEMRLRTWARRNYTPLDDRQSSWHPVILDEMTRKDREQADRSVNLPR